MLRTNPNFYHTLHEQVAIGLSEKEQEESEQENSIDKLREELITKNATGLILETCVGLNMNRKYYNEQKILKIIGLDWVQ